MTVTPDKSQPVALVTGAGAPRIGDCIARTLSARGYRLVLHANQSIDRARTTAAELSRRGPAAMAVAAELADEGAIGAMFARIMEAYGRLDALVNAAAVWESKVLEDVTADDVRRHFEVNTLGTFLCCQEGGLIMVSQTAGGVIVNLGDWAVARPYADYAAYFPSKGAIPALTRAFAVELARRNPHVRVNAVLPGPVMLPPGMPEKERIASLSGTLLKREGSPQNVADAVVFLLENDYITGVCLPVDGGRSVYSE